MLVRQVTLVFQVTVVGLATKQYVLGTLLLERLQTSFLRSSCDDRTNRNRRY